MGVYGSPEHLPAPEPRYELNYCKHCRVEVYGDYCSLCGRALSRWAKWRTFWSALLITVIGVVTFFLVIGLSYSSH